MVFTRIVLLFVIALLAVETLGAVTKSKRSLVSNASANASAEGSMEKSEICQGRTPCGWAVYNRTTRFIDYFMRNKCQCIEDKRCLRDEDDISITAYVYRCNKIDDDATTRSTS